MARVYGTKSEEEALKHLLKVANSNPNDPFTWHAIGLQLYRTKSYNDALKSFLRAEQIKSGISASNLYYIGDCLQQIGQKIRAIEFFSKALTIPVRNRVDEKGYAQAKKALNLLGLSDDEIEGLVTSKSQ